MSNDGYADPGLGSKGGMQSTTGSDGSLADRGGETGLPSTPAQTVQGSQQGHDTGHRSGEDRY